MGGSVSGGKSGSESESESDFSQRVPGFQKNALTNLYGHGESLYDWSGSNMKDRAGGAADWMTNVQNQAMPQWQDMAQGGAYKDMNIGGNLERSLMDSMNAPSNTQSIYRNIMGGEGNDYADAMRSQLSEDASNTAGGVLSLLDQRAANAGASGGSRHGIAQGKAIGDITSNLQKNLTDIGYNTFDKDLAQKLNIADMADQNTFGRQQLMSNMLGQKQGVMDRGLDRSKDMQSLGMGQFSPYMAPWKAAGAYANTIGSPIVLGSGSADSSSKGKGKGSGASGGIK